MHKKPPPEDEQLEHPQPSQSSSRQARMPRRPQSYSSDEHPEIPKVKRASLYLDASKTSPISTAYAGRPRKFSGPGEDQDDSAPSRITTKNTKIMVERQRRSAIYEPPLIQHRPDVLHKRLAHLQALSQNKSVKHTTLAILLTLMILLIIGSLLHSGFSHAFNNISILNINNSDGVASNNPPTDPHQLTITPSDLDHPAPAVFAASAYLLDADTGATLYAHNPFTHLPMLSTTKLMTALLAAEQGNPDQNITITDAIDKDIQQLSADSSVMGLKKGEVYTLRDLLNGLMLVSGNDAAIAIADALDGNLNTFVAKMNQRARQLGLYDTHYVNPHGLLADGHYSCAHDLAILGRISLGNPLIHQISGTKEYHITQSLSHADHDLFNGNQFLWWYPGVDSGKPGWDGATNFIQVVSVTRNHRHLIGVTMHTNDWWTDMRDLMNWGFDNFAWISPYDVDLLHPIPFDTDWNFFVKDKKENTIPTADQGRYYIFTGYSISGSTLTYFDKNGGLKKFGFPISEPKTATNLTTQTFEHGTIQCDTNTKTCSML